MIFAINLGVSGGEGFGSPVRLIMKLIAKPFEAADYRLFPKNGIMTKYYFTISNKKPNKPYILIDDFDNKVDEDKILSYGICVFMGIRKYLAKTK